MKKEEINQVIKRHAHDFRNHLNGIEMELMLLEMSVTEATGLEAVERIRKESTEMDERLRWLTNRISDVERLPIPAMDVFNLWKSKNSGENGPEEEYWNCQLSDELICVDMRILADTLSECIRGMNAQAITLSATATGDEICFCVHSDNSAMGETPPLPVPLGFETLINSNGGSYRRGESEDSIVCAFPLVEPTSATSD